jgi:hypothetical protein
VIGFRFHAFCGSRHCKEVNMGKLSRCFITVSAFIFFIGLALAVSGAELFVSRDRGDNQNPGTKAAPFKNIEAALKAAKAGDRICVALGNYFGLRGKGCLEVTEAIELVGGYAADFSTRDFLKYPTTVIPDRNSGASGRKPLLSVVNVPAGTTFVLDGFILDRGAQNA